MQLDLFQDRDWQLPFQRWLLNLNSELERRYILNSFDVFINPHAPLLSQYVVRSERSIDFEGEL